MEDPELILKEHVDLLKSRGYDEHTLKNGFLQESLFDGLRRELFRAVAEMKEDGFSRAFQVKTSGAFHDNRDIVDYRLYYRADPEKSDVYLQRLEVSHEGFGKTFNLQTSYHLPSSKEAFEQLMNDRLRIPQRYEQRFGKQRPLSNPKKRGRRL